ncbi:hypothetical protein CEUSTIGMA_g9681.t1 [Chlamydomonas eustigma]|uniref:Uncharacterized protein n=1 Tax=Chlamydomonas eustigma TaxID=1157962 RepID=A0A250XGS2_9CHLO|nr:hypothetical protein CEUSTIGMA_g9681.t1 [Chlamydomonas eustigma]|eukprot:GAX82253.1 hypothetical protein CEUSTIGMA_g9681.t1 [Chlamydomonas eustigma]
MESKPELGTYQCSIRLRRFQKLVSESGVDGLLFIGGVDSGFNPGCSQGISHLIYGSSNRDCADAGHLEGGLGDAIFLIKALSIYIYTADGATAAMVSDLLSETTSEIQILYPTPPEASDPDAVEEHKIGSFVQMLRGCKVLAMPWASESTPKQLDLMQLEKWPLLQAYGLEHVGRGGFFTQNFQILNVYNELHAKVYGNMDGHSVERVIGTSAPILQQHWMEMLHGLGKKAVGSAAATLTERLVAEPILGYFSYGMLRPSQGVSQSITMVPRVLVGARTNADDAMSESLPLHSAPGPYPGAPALHMVAEAADGRGPLRVCRTMFLTQGVLTPDLFADKEEEADEGYDYATTIAGWNGEDALLLMRLYAAVVAAARAAMEHFALKEGSTVLSAKGVAVQSLAQHCELFGVAQPALSQQLRFSLWECDHLNRVQAAADRGSRKLKVLRLAIKDIQSKVHPGSLLGAVAYADTFLEVPAHSGRPAQLLNFTERLPAITSLSALGAEAAAALHASKSFTRLASASPASVIEAGERVAAAKAAKRKQEETRAARMTAKAAAAKLKKVQLMAKTGADDVAPIIHKRGAADEDGDEGQKDQDSTESEEEGLDPQDAKEEEDDALDADNEQDGLIEVDDVTTAVPALMELMSDNGPLGRMLTLGGGEEAVILTGASACSAVPGTMWCFTSGLVFVTQHTQAMWVLRFNGGGLEAITVQDLGAVGEVVVLRGQAAACGLPPACHLTTNRHVALALSSMAQTGRKHMHSVVLPTWHQACTEAANAANASDEPGDGSSSITYLKDSSAANPFPETLYFSMLAAVQLAGHGVQPKRWAAMMLQDDVVEEAVSRLDKLELHSGLAPLDPLVESLLLREPPHAASLLLSAPTAVTLVLGLPGAGQSIVASSLHSILGQQGVRPHVVLIPSDESLCLGQAMIEDVINANVQPSGHLLLVASCMDGVVPVLRLLASCTAFKSGKAYLGSVISCVSADMMYEEPLRGVLMPGLMAQLAAGYVDALVLVPGSSPAAEVTKAQELMQLRNPYVPLLRGSRPSLLRAADDLLPPAADRLARLLQQKDLRLWSAAAGASIAEGHQHPSLFGPVLSCLIKFKGSLDVLTLRLKLEEAGMSATNVEPIALMDTSLVPSKMRILSVVGTLVERAGGSIASGTAPAQQHAVVTELHGSRQAGVKAREWPLAGILPPLMCSPENEGPAGQLLFVGTNLDVGALQALIQTSGKGESGADAPQLRKVASITPTERAAIAQQHLLDDLPEGVCFDGSRYRDEFGDVLKEHPYLDRFVSEYIESFNKDLTDQWKSKGASSASVIIL